MTDIRFDARVRHILEQSVAGLPEEDRAARIAYCQSTGEHGVRAQVDDDCIRFTWGGQLLALVEQSALQDDAYLEPLTLEFFEEPPNDPRDLA